MASDHPSKGAREVILFFKVAKSDFKRPHSKWQSSWLATFHRECTVSFGSHSWSEAPIFILSFGCCQQGLINRRFIYFCVTNEEGSERLNDILKVIQHMQGEEERKHGSPDTTCIPLCQVPCLNHSYGLFSGCPSGLNSQTNKFMVIREACGRSQVLKSQCSTSMS